MKEVFNFVVWQFKRLSVFDYLWFFGALMVGAGWEEKGITMLLGVSSCLLAVIYVFVEMQWNKYKKERNELFGTIKDGK